jgi:IS1 family transposase
MPRFALSHLAITAVRAISLRRSGVNLAARAFPPFNPPSLPSATAAGFFFLDIGPSICEVCGEILERSRKMKKTRQIKSLTIRERSCIVRSMNTLLLDRKLQILSAHVEGTSIRSIERMTGVHRDTITRLLTNVGEGCARFLDRAIRRVCAKRVQVDEIWTFVFKKEAQLNGHDNHAEMGDQYVFIGMDADTKLVISHLVGKRDATTAWYFMSDLRERLANRVQLTTDGFRPYLTAVEDSFGAGVDYAMLVKLYGADRKDEEGPAWYGPAKVIAAMPTRISGKPDMRFISTSYIERQNLTVRMQLRRFTRLTNAFSKKLENLRAAVALHFAHYNFVRIHQTLRVTPAMAAQLTNHLWDLPEFFHAAMAAN